MEDIFDQLLAQGTFDYGCTIPAAELLAYFDFEAATDADMEGWQPDKIRKQIQADVLVELGIVSKIRDKLLDLGRYIGKDKGAYRIFLPSENAQVADNLLASSNRKARRANRLMQATPTQAAAPTNAGSRAAISAVRADRLSARNGK